MIKANFNRVKESRKDEFIDNEKIVEFSDKEKAAKSGIETVSSDDQSSVDVEPEDNMVIHAYKRSWVGNLVTGVFFLQTLGQFAFMIMMCEDYYTNYSLFRAFSEIQASTFMGMWYIFFFWFAGLTIFRFRLPNFFRIRCSYGQGQYVQIERKEPGRTSKLVYLYSHTNSYT